MGGQASEVSDATTDVLLESASFARGGILRTARRLDLHTRGLAPVRTRRRPGGGRRAAPTRGAQLHGGVGRRRVPRGVADAGDAARAALGVDAAVHARRR